MSTNIDERVVKMSFDDTNFEAGANKAIGILDNLRKALNFDSASEGISSAQKAIDGLSMDSVSSSVERCSRSFGAFEAFTFGVFARVGQKVADLGETIVKRLTIQGAIDGFKEYELQMGSIQTILSNTGDKLKARGIETQAEQIGYINQKLDELNEYADKTIYNFTQMTKNIGLFTAAGVDLDTATSAIQGISNLAAASGADNAALGRAMYNLSQALSTGTVRLMDWNSVVNAGMGGELFQEALKRTARVHGIAVDEIIQQQGSFRESLSKGWLTADVLTETLEQLTIEYDEVGDAAYDAAYKQLRNSGYSHDAAVAILDLAKNASEAATKVRTWTQLWDTVGESIGSGWAQTWRTIVGDFLEATDLFTWFSDKITGIVGASNDARNAMLEEWAAAGGRKALVDALKNIYEMVERPLSAIANAFSSVFGISAEQLYNITTALATFTGSLKLSDEAVEILTMVFTDVFTVAHSVLGVIGNLVRIFVDLARVAWTVVQPFSEIAFLLFGFFADGVARFSERVLSVVDAIEERITLFTDGITVTIGALLNGRMTLSGALKQLGILVSNVFGKPALSSISSFGERLKESLGNAISSALDFLRGLFSGDKIGIDLFDNFIEKAEELKGRLVVTLEGIKFAFGSLISGKISIFRFFSVIEKVLGLTFENLRNSARSAFSSAKEIAVHIFEGLRSGISDRLTSLWEWAQSIGETILNAVKNFLGIESPSKEFFEVGKNVILGLVNGLQEFIGKIGETAREIGSSLLEIVSIIASSIKTSIGNLASKIFDKLPAPVKNALKAIKSFAIGFVSNAKKMVTGSAFFTTLMDEVKRIQGGELPNVGRILSGFGSTVLSVFGSIKDFIAKTPLGSMFETIAGSIKKFAASLGISIPTLSDIGGYFSNLGDQISSSDAFTTLSGLFEKIPETFKSLFDQTKETVEYGQENVSKGMQSLDFSNAIPNVNVLVETLSSIPEIIMGAVDDLVTAINEFIDAFGLREFIESGDALRRILDLGILVTLRDFVNSFMKIGNMAQAVSNWPKELGNALSRFGEGFNHWRKETKAEAVVKIAVGIAILAGSLFLLASIPAEDLSRAAEVMVKMGAAIIALLAVLAFMDSKLTLFSTASMQNVGNAVKGLGIGVLAFSAALFVLSKVPADSMNDNLFTLVEIAAVLALMAKAIASDGKSIRSGAFGMILMAGAVYAMAKAIEAIGGLDPALIDQGMAPFVAIMIMLTLFGKFAGEGISKLLGSFLKLGTGLLLVALSIAILGSALEVLSSSLKNIDNLPVVLGVLAGVLLAFGLFSGLLKDVDTTSVAVSLTIFAASLLIMVAALGALSYVIDQFGGNVGFALGALVALIAVFGALSYALSASNLEYTARSLVVFGASLLIMAGALAALTYVVSQDGASFGNALMSLIALLASFGILSSVLSAKDTMTVATAIVVFGAALVVMAGAMLLLQKVNMQSIIPQLIAIAVALGVFAGLSFALSGIAPAMLLVAQSMLVFSAAVLVLAGAFWILTQALTNLSGIDPLTIVSRLTAMGAGLGGMLVSFFATIFSALKTAITEHWPEILEAGKEILRGIGEGIRAGFEWVKANGGEIIGKIKEGLSGAMSWLSENGPQIIQAVIDGLSSGWQWLQENGGTIVSKIGEGLLAAKDTILPKIKEVLDGIGAKITDPEFQTQMLEKAKTIGQAILDGIGMIFEGVGEVVANLFSGLKGAIDEKISAVAEWGRGIGESLFGGTEEALEVNSPSKRFERIGGFVIEGLSNGLDDTSVLSEKGSILGQVLETAIGFLPGSFQEVGRNALTNISSAFSGGQSEVSGKVKGIVDGASESAKGLGGKLKGAASTAMSTFSTSIKSGTAGVKLQVTSIVNSASSAVAPLGNKLKSEATKAMNAFSSAIKSGSGAAKNAVNGVMNAASSSVKSMYKKFYDVGRNAVQGLINGIDSLLGRARSKADELTNVVVKVVRAKFQVKSPSRVFMGIGQNLVQGLINGMDDLLGEAATAGSDLSGTVVDSFGNSLNGMAIGMDDLLDTDYNPVITPVINSAEFDSNLQQLSAMMNHRLSDSMNIGSVNYNETFAGKLDAVADINKQAMQQFAESAIDYELLGMSVANALIRSGVHVEMDGGQLMGYLAGEIRDVRRMSR